MERKRRENGTQSLEMPSYYLISLLHHHLRNERDSLSSSTYFRQFQVIPFLCLGKWSVWLIKHFSPWNQVVPSLLSAFLFFKSHIKEAGGPKELRPGTEDEFFLDKLDIWMLTCGGLTCINSLGFVLVKKKKYPGAIIQNTRVPDIQMVQQAFHCPFQRNHITQRTTKFSLSLFICLLPSSHLGCRLNVFYFCFKSFRPASVI